MAWQLSTRVQLGGFILSLFGWVLSCVTTVVPFWKTLQLELNELETRSMGLWHVCVTQDESLMECKGQASLLALPLEFKVSRVVMVTANGLGLLAFLLSILALKCLKTGDQNPRRKRHFGIAGGTLFCVSGMANLVPISWVAYTTVQEFLDETMPEIVSRWEFGEALFLGWFAAFFLILGGFLLICACFLEAKEPPKQLAVYCKPRMQTSVTLPRRHPYSPPKNADLVI
ncbi:putative claudin-25 [Elgaria multicarinata webbii]|uniref:putative claudin-25 n=1 Tax=Elgaria multicarinata webbii TaxID=159646 RepID=UPI002FCD2061